MKYTIETKQVKSLRGMIFTKKQDVINSIKMFDLQLPFRIMNEENNDVTSEFVDNLNKEGYKFIDKKNVAEKIPVDLQEVMNKYYKNMVTLSTFNKMPIKLVTVKDIKSISGFYELWDKESITIGTSGTNILFYELSSKNICIISLASINDMTKKSIVTKTVDEFVKIFKENV